ncbi:MAG: hypothetical protein H6554_03915 [Chitinophagales bacterium]|nr:hypothetical protein [Chitinophagales bacterium]
MCIKQVRLLRLFDNIALGTAGIGSDISVTPYSGVDNCPGSSYITVFPNGGSCQSSGCQTQQRWQTRYGGATLG